MIDEEIKPNDEFWIFTTPNNQNKENSLFDSRANNVKPYKVKILKKSFLDMVRLIPLYEVIDSDKNVFTVTKKHLFETEQEALTAFLLETKEFLIILTETLEKLNRENNKSNNRLTEILKIKDNNQILKEIKEHNMIWSTLLTGNL